MQRSPKSPVDPHDAHLRRLLDQRATRADLHSRVPSLSDCSDTPSLYSHAYFSPQPAHFNSSLDEMSSNLASPIRSERDRFNDLAVSMLDMDDEPRSSYSSNEYDDLDGGDQSTIEQHQEEDEDELAMPRVSMLGLKMRFHSEAPWETDDSFAQQEEDSEDDGETHSILSSSNRSKGGPARHFLFGGSKSGNNGRSSRESSRSRRKMKKSFDTMSSTNSHGRGAVHTLAQATLSSTSLVPGGPRQPFPSSRVRSVSPSSARFSPSSPRSPTFSGNAVEGALMNCSSSSGDSEPRPSFAYSVEDTHPYARSNASVHMEQHPPFLSRKIEFTDIPRSETSSTLTGSNAPYIPPNKQPQALAPAPLVQEPVPQSPRLQAFGREISSPVSFRGTAHIGDRSDINTPCTVDITGWTERAVSPSFNLISTNRRRNRWLMERKKSGFCEGRKHAQASTRNTKNITHSTTLTKNSDRETSLELQCSGRHIIITSTQGQNWYLYTIHIYACNTHRVKYEFFLPSDPRRALVIVTTPSRIYQLVGTPDPRNDDSGRIFSIMFALYRDEVPKMLELPGDTQHSELHFYTANPEQANSLPRSLAWMTGKQEFRSAVPQV
ncbi:hypothetical protein C8R42DRAFT_751635 [Lentinula raphanica]|nr:hypothetical protein C8R42DRAFT_751635 [Lentinula raphanica]